MYLTLTVVQMMLKTRIVEREISNHVTKMACSSGSGTRVLQDA